MCWSFNTLAIQKAMEQAGSNNFRQNFVKTWHFMYSSWGSGLSYCRLSVTSVEFVVAPEASTNEKRDSEFVWQICDSALSASIPVKIQGLIQLTWTVDQPVNIAVP